MNVFPCDGNNKIGCSSKFFEQTDQDLVSMPTRNEVVQTLTQNSLAEAGIISEPKSFAVGKRHLKEDKE